jgi:hypothetical protein
MRSVVNFHFSRLMSFAKPAVETIQGRTAYRAGNSFVEKSNRPFSGWYARWDSNPTTSVSVCRGDRTAYRFAGNKRA